MLQIKNKVRHLNLNLIVLSISDFQIYHLSNVFFQESWQECWRHWLTFPWETFCGQSVDIVLSDIFNSESFILVCRSLWSKPLFLFFMSGASGLDVDELAALIVVSFVPRSVKLSIVLKPGYLLHIPCLTFLSNKTCETKMKTPCSEFAMTNIYWNTTASSLTARIPNSQVTPKTGRRVPSDRRPDEAFFCSEDFAIMLEANSTLSSEAIISMLIILIRQTGMINK